MRPVSCETELPKLESSRAPNASDAEDFGPSEVASPRIAVTSRAADEAEEASCSSVAVDAGDEETESPSPKSSFIVTSGGAGGCAGTGSAEMVFATGGAGLSSLRSTGERGFVTAVAEAASCTFSCEPIEMKEDSGLAGGANGTVGATAAGFDSRGGVATDGLMTGAGGGGVSVCDSKFICDGATILAATGPSEGNWTPQ